MSRGFSSLRKRLSRLPSFFWKSLLLKTCSFSLMAALSEARLKNFSFRRAAMIHVEMIPTVPSALGLSFGLRTRAGMIAVL